ncbi:hypothetical protein C3489_32350 [Streptomyces sp. Ru71]|nr:hypothetical protein C3489_32350 [Streptomyces sp. Ru71]
MTGVVCGAAVAAAALTAPAGAQEKRPDRTTVTPAPAKARLSTGETAELDRGALRVTGPDGKPAGAYAFAEIGGRTEVTPVGRRAPQPTTVLGDRGAGATAGDGSARTAAATAATQRVKIDLVNAYQIGPLIHVWNRSTWQYYDVREEQFDDFGTVDLPPGDYLTIGVYNTWQQPSLLMAKTFTVGAAPMTVTLDAKLTKPTRIATDDASAVRQSAAIWYSLPGGHGIAGFAGGWGNEVRVTPISFSGLTLSVQDTLGRKGSTPNRPSPYRYDLLHRFRDGVPANPVATVRTADLVKTRTTVRAPGAGVSAQFEVWPHTGEDGVMTPGGIPTGGTFTHYLTPGLTYSRLLYQGSQSAWLPDITAGSGPGELPGETFGQAPYTVSGGPNPDSSWFQGTFRLHEDGPTSGANGQYGTEFDAQHTFEITADGQQLGRSGPLQFHEYYELPVGQYATYGIRHTVTRAGTHTRLSPRVTTDWLLSGSVLSKFDRTVLPLLDVGVDVPSLDVRNHAAAGPVAVDVSLRNRGGHSYDPALTSVEYSVDDGATWRTAPVGGDGGASGTATVDVPSTAAFVSLRIAGRDTSGGTVTQTVTRAFAGPAPATALRTGPISVSGVTVNNNRPLVLGTTGVTFPARFVVNTTTGLESATVTLHHGTYDRPDGLLSAPAQCTLRQGTTRYYDCTAMFGLDGGQALGLNKLSGTWTAGALVQGTERSTQFQGPAPAGGITLQRSTALTIAAAPQPITRGATLTVTGKLSGAAWEYGAPAGLAGQKVELQFKMAGSGTTWSTLATGTTDSTGTVVLKRAAWNDGGWRLHYAGDASTAGSYSWVDNVDVR